MSNPMPHEWFFGSNIRNRARRTGANVRIGSLAGPFARGIVVELNHDAVRIGDENLPQRSAGNLDSLERDVLRLQTLFHGTETAADEGDVVDNAGIRFLRLAGRG